MEGSDLRYCVSTTVGLVLGDTEHVSTTSQYTVKKMLKSWEISKTYGNQLVVKLSSNIL